jgi:hypothetical protein
MVCDGGFEAVPHQQQTLLIVSSSLGHRVGLSSWSGSWICIVSSIPVMRSIVLGSHSPSSLSIKVTTCKASNLASGGELTTGSDPSKVTRFTIRLETRRDSQINASCFGDPTS